MVAQRSFTVVSIGGNSKGLKSKKGGRYMSSSAMGAAKKAFNRECNSSSVSGVCAFDVVLRETTAGSRKKLYKYHVRRVANSSRVGVKFPGRASPVVFRFKIVASRA